MVEVPITGMTEVETECEGGAEISKLSELIDVDDQLSNTATNIPTIEHEMQIYCDLQQVKTAEAILFLYWNTFNICAEKKRKMFFSNLLS